MLKASVADLGKDGRTDGHKLHRGATHTHKITLPDTVEDIAVWKDPDVKVGLQDCMKSTNLFVPEKKILSNSIIL